VSVLNKMEEQKEQNEEPTIRCSECGSKLGYLRLKDHCWVCRTCGAIKKVGEEKNG